MNKVLIIHGHGNRSWILSNDSSNRCEQALSVVHQGFNQIICSGGLFNERQRGIPVSLAMKTWLAPHLGDIEIVAEKESLTTIHNSEMCLKLLSPGDDLFVVTSGYHAWRTKMIWKLIGKRKITLVPVASKISFSKLLTELIAIGVTLCYFIGFKWPERYFRQKCRTTSNAQNLNSRLERYEKAMEEIEASSDRSTNIVDEVYVEENDRLVIKLFDTDPRKNTIVREPGDLQNMTPIVLEFHHDWPNHEIRFERRDQKTIILHISSDNKEGYPLLIANWTNEHQDRMIANEILASLLS